MPGQGQGVRGRGGSRGAVLVERHRSVLPLVLSILLTGGESVNLSAGASANLSATPLAGNGTTWSHSLRSPAVETRAGHTRETGTPSKLTLLAAESRGVAGARRAAGSGRRRQAADAGGERRIGAGLHLSTIVPPAPSRINVAAAQSGTQHTEGGTKEKLAPKSWFAITFSFAFVIKALCMLSNVAFQVSPLPQVRKFTKEQDTGDVDAAPFVSILYNGSQWCFYGIFAYEYTQKSGFLVLVYSNFMGVFLGMYYIWVFQSNCQSGATISKLLVYYRGVGVMVGIQIVAIAVMSRQQALYFCGLVSSACSVLGSCSLLSTLPVVLRDRCSASINLPLLIAGMAGSVLWIICGFFLWDFLIVLPNVMGLMIQSICMSLVVYFPRDRDSSDSVDGSSDRYLLTASSARGQRGHDYGTLKDCGETGGTW